MIISDEVYIATFQATGCPSKTPFLGWWKTQSDKTVLNDMNTYCELVKDGQASDEQRGQCCGSEDCTINECVKQTAWAKGI